jgi:hypothetical protein
MPRLQLCADFWYSTVTTKLLMHDRRRTSWLSNDCKFSSMLCRSEFPRCSKRSKEQENHVQHSCCTSTCTPSLTEPSRPTSNPRAGEPGSSPACTRNGLGYRQGVSYQTICTIPRSANGSHTKRPKNNAPSDIRTSQPGCRVCTPTSNFGSRPDGQVIVFILGPPRFNCNEQPHASHAGREDPVLSVPPFSPKPPANHRLIRRAFGVWPAVSQLAQQSCTEGTSYRALNAAVWNSKSDPRGCLLATVPVTKRTFIRWGSPTLSCRSGLGVDASSLLSISDTVDQ